MASLRWYREAARHLVGATYTVDVESCRRVVVTSCEGREHFVPSTVAEALAATSPGSTDMLVVMAGYNDSPVGFDLSVRALGDVARSLGIDTIVWLRLTSPNPAHSAIDTADHNAALDDVVLSASSSEWIVADWPRFAAQRSNVFEADGIHLTLSGAEALADFLSAVVATLDSPACLRVTNATTSANCPASSYLVSQESR